MTDQPNGGRALVNYDEEYAKQAARYAEQEQLAGGTFLSIKGGTLTLGEETLPGNQACVIILDAVLENTFYGSRYVEGNVNPPVCYAFARGDEPLAPHHSMQTDLNYFQPQSNDCASCQWNQYGSADVGKGKACQNRRRLAILPAGFYTPRRGSRDFDLEYFNDPKHYAKADVFFIKLPVLSVKNFSKYTQLLAAPPIRRPPFGVITRMFVEPDQKAQYMVHFEMLEAVPPELFDAIQARQIEAARSVVKGYLPPDPNAQKAPQGSLRGLRR